MRVIGVIDLKAGRAVHARGGQRGAYEPVRSALLPPDRVGDAVALAGAYRRQLGLEEIYVADLDAIGGHECSTLLPAICGAGEVVMVDAGVADEARALAVLATAAARVVVGLETLPSFDVLERLVAAIGASRLVFSLDLRNGIPVTPITCRINGPIAVARRAAAAGMTAVLALDLARVGQGSGPDVTLITALRREFPGLELLAGGGVRGAQDLQLLADAGCDGALVGTALHRGVRLGVRF